MRILRACLPAIILWCAATSGAALELKIEMTSNVPRIWINGANGAVTIEFSTNLNRVPRWSLLTNVQAVSSPFLFTDSASATSMRFFRASVDATSINSLPHLVWIEPGTFTVGAPAGELYRNSEEGPLTEVTLTRGFAMSKFETTQQEYLGLMGNNPSGFSDDLQRPANFVTWTEASNYCARLTARETLAGHLPPGYTYRLPTEAQWEYACRAGTTTATYFGNSLSSTQANFNGTGPYNGAAAGPNLQTTTRVGSFPPNAWGLFDMAGNVSEWTASLYSNELPGGSLIDPVNLGFSGGYCYRGGSWQDYGWQCRSATRYGTGSESRIARLGFRIILTPGQPDSATPPLILRQPQSLTAKSGEAVTFSLTASGTPLFYQWRLNGADIPGATDPTYRIALVQVTDTGLYSVVVRNSAGHATSLAAALTVDPLPNPDAARLVWINPGAFMMGSPSNEVGRADDEGPQTQVTVTRGFWMSKFETTQQEYLAVMGNNPSAFAGNLQRPVEMVTWNNATNYCGKLTLVERAAGRLPVGYEYRLPTEAEWEYACRAGTTTATAYGDSLSSTQANYNGNFPYGGANAGPYLQTTSPAGSYVPNAWGLYDMHGNVREWCLDWYGAYPGGSASDPRGVSTDPYRAIRGGDWISQGHSARSAARAFALPGEVVNGGYGFRTVVAPSQWNGGFEQGTLTGWKTTGDFSAMEPINGDVISVKRVPALWQQLSNTIGGDYWRDLTYPVGQKGLQWLSTAYPRKGTNSWDDQAFNEAAVGSLISQSFVIQNKFITFLMGGGQDDAALRVELLIQATAGPATIEIEGQNYQIVNHATGHGQEWMRRVHWDVSGPALKNRMARIRIVDASTSGHLNVDDFRFQDLAPLDDLLTVGGQSYPATATFQGYEIDADAPAWGFADMHTHPMSYLGFGGKIMHGQPDGGPATPTSMAVGLSDCKLDHGGWGTDNPQGNYWRQLMMMALDDAGPDPHREGWATDPAVQFRNWPVFTTIAHQQMWYEWIKRARDGGLRVMVALCVNNHLLARVSKGDKPIDDLAVGDSQIAELKNFVARHDDFLEIAYDPFQLRDIVRRGKLAIVIGSELDDIGNFISNPTVKTNADVTSKLLVSAEIRRLHTNGVRYIFPVHLVNNKFSGTAIAGLMLNIANKYASGEGFQVQAASANDNIHFWLENIDLRAQVGLENVSPEVADFILGAGAVAGASLIPIVLPWLATTASLITAPLPGSSAAFTGLAPLAVIGAAGLLPPLLTIIGIDQGDVVEAVIPLPGNYPIYPTPAEAPNGVRNALGLTDLGRHAIKEMMNLGMLIDIDHMSQEGFTGPDGALALATNRPGGYPLNSGHNGFRESGVEERPENSRSLTQMEEIRRLGGLIGVGWENSKGGSYTKPATEVVPTPFYSHSIVSNDCAGTAKTFAQGYLVALERLGAAHVAIGTDIDGFVVSPGPRFGPQAAFGLGEAGGVEASEREEQIAAQHNGVLYEPRYGPALTTAAFRGRAMEPKKLIDPADATQGYAYNVDQADFFAALNIFYTLKADVEAGRMVEQTVMASINTIVNAYSENYSGQYPEADLSGGSRAHIANYALGLLAGIKDWTIGSDATPDKTATTTIGKAVYGRKNIGNYQPPTEIVSNQDYFDRYLHHSDIWDDYQKIFGTNTPMKRCQTGSKQWDVNFEGVAHYGLLPDFLQDLSNVGMQARDLSVLFRSAEDFAQMWTRSLNASFPAQ